MQSIRLGSTLRRSASPLDKIFLVLIPQKFPKYGFLIEKIIFKPSAQVFLSFPTFCSGEQHFQGGPRPGSAPSSSPNPTDLLSPGGRQCPWPVLFDPKIRWSAWQKKHAVWKNAEFNGLHQRLGGRKNEI